MPPPSPIIPKYRPVLFVRKPFAGLETIATVSCPQAACLVLKILVCWVRKKGRKEQQMTKVHTANCGHVVKVIRLTMLFQLDTHFLPPTLCRNIRFIWFRQ
jgi:hypothetical protein